MNKNKEQRERSEWRGDEEHEPGWEKRRGQTSGTEGDSRQNKKEKPHSNEAPWTGASGGTQRQADKHTELGLEHPWRNCPGKERPGLRKDEDAAAATKAGGQQRRT